MSAARWDRLAAALHAGGVDADVEASPYPGGITRSITLLQPGRGLVHIRDSWWRKNPDIWVGYTVTAEDADGIVIRQWPATKKRSETVGACRAAIERVYA